jgi:hypothetical protein
MFRKSAWMWLVAFAGCSLLTPYAASRQRLASKAAPVTKAEFVVEFPMGISDVRYESGNRPDPFLNPLGQSKGKVDPNSEMPRGNPLPGIAGMSTNEVELLGMSLSPEGKTAVFRGTDHRVYFLREGDRLFDGYLKAITIDSVLLIRETPLRSGKVLTQEITKRLRT